MTNRFRPSKASYWGKCAAYQRFTRDAPETTNDAAREGTCAAWVAEVVLKDATGITCADMIGQTHSNGWLVSKTMANDVQEYVNLVRSYGGIVTAEEHVRVSDAPLIEGTLDVSVTSIDEGVLRISDLKYGRKIVETTSPQLVCYGYGKLMTLPPGSIREIHLGIYQPRGFHRDGPDRKRVVTPEQLHEEFVQLWAMAVEGEKPDSIATPGPHCMECEAAAGCEALTQTTYNLVHTVMSRSNRDMTPSELASELDFIDEVKTTVNARFKAIETEAEARLKRQSIPGWTLKPNKGNRVFTVSGVTAQLLTGIDPWEKGLCTPAELERRGATKDQLKVITKQPVTSMKLQRVTSDDIAAIFNATKG